MELTSMSKPSEVGDGIYPNAIHRCIGEMSHSLTRKVMSTYLFNHCYIDFSRDNFNAHIMPTGPAPTIRTVGLYMLLFCKRIS